MADFTNESKENRNLPYTVDDIIGSTLSSQIHKKPLQNAENMVKKGNMKSALEIYSRIQQRIKDPEANQKIAEIIQGIGKDVEKSDGSTGSKPIPRSREEQKVNFTKVLRDLTNVVSHLSNTIQTQPPPPEPGSPAPISREPAPAEMGMEAPPSFSDSPPPSNFDRPGAMGQQVGTPSPGGGADTSKGLLNRLEILEDIIANQEWKDERQSPIEDRRTGAERRTNDVPVDIERRTGNQRRGKARPTREGNNQEVLERLDALEKQNKELAEKISKEDNESDSIDSSASPQERKSAGLESQVPPSSDPPSAGGTGDFSKIINRLDALEELYKRDDWKELRDLPLRDRRTGGDRRKESVPVDEDKRKDSDRRNEDLLEKRDEFVSDWQDTVEKGETPPPVDTDQNKLRKEAPVTPPPPPPLIRTILESDSDLPRINLPDPVMVYPSNFQEAPKRSMSIDPGAGSQKPAEEGLTTSDVLYPTEKDEQVHEIFKINLPNPKDTSFKKRESEDDEDTELDRDINIVDSPLSDEEYEKAVENRPEISIPEIDTESKEAPEPERVMHGILELKPPEVDDAPFLTLTYDFTKIPHSFRLSKNYSVMEYSYYKYKPMLMKAQEFARRKLLKNALNYYRVIRSQNIPPELKHMINRNIMDITEFLEKFLMSKGG